MYDMPPSAIYYYAGQASGIGLRVSVVVMLVSRELNTVFFYCFKSMGAPVGYWDTSAKKKKKLIKLFIRICVNK